MDDMDFGEALKALRAGERVCRRGWNGKGMWLALIRSEQLPVMESSSDEPLHWLPFIAMRPVGGGLVPWLASQTDILAEDWETLFP